MVVDERMADKVHDDFVDSLMVACEANNRVDEFKRLLLLVEQQQQQQQQQTNQSQFV